MDKLTIQTGNMLIYLVKYGKVSTLHLLKPSIILTLLLYITVYKYGKLVILFHGTLAQSTSL